MKTSQGLKLNTYLFWQKKNHVHRVRRKKGWIVLCILQIIPLSLVYDYIVKYMFYNNNIGYAW